MILNYYYVIPTIYYYEHAENFHGDCIGISNISMSSVAYPLAFRNISNSWVYIVLLLSVYKRDWRDTEYMWRGSKDNGSNKNCEHHHNIHSLSFSPQSVKCSVDNRYSVNTVVQSQTVLKFKYILCAFVY